jgi:WD40 repeat protein
MQTFEDVDIFSAHKDYCNNKKDIISALKQQIGFGPTCSLLAGLANAKAIVWDRKTGAQVATLNDIPQGKSSRINYISLINDHELALAGYTIVIWNFKNNTQRTLKNVFIQQHQTVKYRILSPTTNILIVVAQNGIEIWNTETPRRLKKYTHATNNELAFFNSLTRVNDELVALYCQPDVVLFNYNTLNLHKIITKPELKKISQMSASNGKLYIHTPQKLYRLGIEDESLTVIADSQGYCFGFEVFHENLFVATKAISLYRIHYGRTTTVHEDTAAVIGKVDSKFIMFQEQSKFNVILYDPFTDKNKIELEGLPGICVCPFTTY